MKKTSLNKILSKAPTETSWAKSHPNPLLITNWVSQKKTSKKARLLIKNSNKSALIKLATWSATSKKNILFQSILMI